MQYQNQDLSNNFFQVKSHLLEPEQLQIMDEDSTGDLIDQNMPQNDQIQQDPYIETIVEEEPLKVQTTFQNWNVQEPRSQLYSLSVAENTEKEEVKDQLEVCMFILHDLKKQPFSYNFIEEYNPNSQYYQYPTSIQSIIDNTFNKMYDSPYEMLDDIIEMILNCMDDNAIEYMLAARSQKFIEQIMLCWDRKNFRSIPSGQFKKFAQYLHNKISSSKFGQIYKKQLTQKQFQNLSYEDQQNYIKNNQNQQNNNNIQLQRVLSISSQSNLQEYTDSEEDEEQSQDEEDSQSQSQSQYQQQNFNNNQYKQKQQYKQQFQQYNMY